MLGEMEVIAKEIGVKRNKVYVLDSAVLTSFGDYRYTKITEGIARDILKTNDFISAVGDKLTAEIMSKILGVKIPYNHIEIKMNIGDVAVVFKRKGAEIGLLEMVD